MTNLYLDKRDELATCQVNFASKKAEVVACNELVTNQNIAIGKWEVKGRELEVKVKKLTEDFAVIENKYNKSIYDIANTKVPESCEGSMSWLVDQGKLL